MIGNCRLLLTVYFLWSVMIRSKAEENENELKCKYGVEKKVYVANCEHKDRTEFPTNLDSRIEGLYLNGTEILEINDNSFEKLTSLKYLYLDHNGGTKISSNAFKPLSNLNTLDLSNNNVPDIYLPTTLENLYLNYMKIPISKLPVNSLPDLKFLSLRGNKLDQIPFFGSALPSLEILDLSKNNIANFKFVCLADLCHLRVLVASSISVQDNCECLRLKKWIYDKNIEISSNINCRSTKYSNQICDTSQPEDFRQKYESCKDEASRRKLMKTLTRWAYICGIIVAVIAMCFSCFVLYVFCNRKNLADNTIRAYFCCKKKKNQRESKEGWM